LVRSKRVTNFIIAAPLILCASCKPQPKKPAVSFAAAPQTRATVLTIETTIQPSNKKIVHSLTIANDRARSGDELDQWRLFDLKANTVTYVDNIKKTYRTEPIASLVEQHRAALAAAIPTYIPRAEVAASAGKIIIRAGGYARTLTVVDHPLIPPQLFSWMVASDPSESPYAPMMKVSDEALLNMRGFPMSDHAEMAVDGKKLAIDRNVVNVEQKNIDASWLSVPAHFADVSPRAGARGLGGGEAR
jgi:hypothetical protein